MKKKIFVILITVDLLCIIAVFIGFTNTALLIKCFKNTGAEFQRLDIEGKGEIVTLDSTRSAAEALFKGLGLSEDNSQYNLVEKDDTSILSYSSNGISVEIKTRKMQTKNKLYASVKLSQFNPDVNITNIRRSISGTFLHYKIKPSFSSLVTGKFNGFLSPSQMKEKIFGIYKRRFAKNLEGIEDSNMVSYSGYVNGIRDKISYMGKWVNLNTALRYSKTDSCTYIWIGSPIILLEY